MRNHGPWRLWPLILIVALVCIGAAEPGSEVDDDKATKLMDAISLFLVVAVVIGLAVWVVVVVRKISDRQSAEEREALQFEVQMGTLHSARTPTEGTAAVSDVGETQTVTAPVAPSLAVEKSPAQSPPSEALSDAAAAIESVMAKLRAAGLYRNIEGRIFLSDGTTEGVIVQLTNGKTAVVLPVLEPPEFMARQIKRFDLCLVPLNGDQVGVLSPMGQYIADHVAL